MNFGAHAFDNSADSGYIATSKTSEGAPAGAQGTGSNVYLYEMKSQPSGIDVSSVCGPEYIYTNEHEVAVPYAIPGEDILGVTMPSGDFLRNPNYVP